MSNNVSKRKGLQRVIVVIGASGVGKSTIAEGVAQRLSGAYLDADEYHPARNVRSMEAGIPLDDAMRWPWLAAVSEAAVREREARDVVVACSCLKRRYRDFMRDRVDGIVFVNPQGTEALIEARMNAREGHYMPPGLLQSQLNDFEAPDPDECAIDVPIDQSADAIATEVVAILLNRGA